VRRFATEDFHIGAAEIKAGQVITLSLGAAARDPLRFPDPDEIDFHRDDKQHLGFGLGPHVCPGMELGRVQVRTALRSLFERFPEIRLAEPADQLRWRHSNFIRVLRALPVIV
jgi:cytochrome P450